MNSPDSHAEAVWRNTLPHIRSMRRRRGYRRVAAAGACGALAAMWLTFQTETPTDNPVVHLEPAAPVFETIAVMKIDDDGTIRLEEVASNELGSLELTLGETPLIPQGQEIW